MPSTTKRRSKLERVQQQRQLAESELATVHAEAQLHMLRKGVFRETAHGDPVPYTDYPSYDAFDGSRYYRRKRPWTTVEDRMRGKWIPAYETERDLARIRGQARSLAAFTSTAIGAIESLVNYVIGTGYKFEAIAEAEEFKDVATAVQEVMDEFLDLNGIASGINPDTGNIVEGMDRELHNRSREDGETFLALHRGSDVAKVCFIEPDQITEPANTRKLEEWLIQTGQIPDGGPFFWDFGILTAHNPHMKCEDAGNPLGYHVIFDNSGTDWDFIPAHRMLHLKRNVGRNAKRGVSDFYAVGRDIEREAKLKANTAEGAAIQAAIAFIREHTEGSTQSGISSFVNANARTDYDQPRKQGTKNVKVEAYNPGMVKDIPFGMKYHAGPLGTLRSPVYIEVAQYILRSIGVRWSMPEYIISGDASNANFASTLVAESPFVKARENDQEFYRRAFMSLMWKAIRLAFESGRLSVHGLSLREIYKVVTIKIDAPEVASRDKQAQAATNQILNTAGVLSRRTWAAQTDLDYEEEQANIASEPSPVDAMPLSLPPNQLSAVQGALESVSTTAEARDTLKQLQLGYP